MSDVAMIDNKTITAVDLKDVWVRFNADWVLKGVNVDLPAGKIFGVVGPNGGGKTTLLKAMIGLIKPQKGRVLIFGQDPQNSRFNRSVIGYLPQLQNFYPNFPVNALDVVLMGLYKKKGLISRINSRDKQIALKALSFVGMEQNASRLFGELSGGQQQRVSIARALVSQPRLLILDEPATGVDIVAQESFYQLLADMRDQVGITIIIVSHDIGVISAYVDSIACLRQVIHYHGSPKECLDSGMVTKVFGHEINVILHDEHCFTCDKGAHE